MPAFLLLERDSWAKNCLTDGDGLTNQQVLKSINILPWPRKDVTIIRVVFEKAGITDANEESFLLRRRRSVGCMTVFRMEPGQLQVDV